MKTASFFLLVLTACTGVSAAQDQRHDGSALYLKIPTLDLGFIVLANSEGVWWDNTQPLAPVELKSFG